MGTNPNSPIVAIGAVIFDPVRGNLGDQFYTAVNLESAINWGAVPDAKTINWWLKQSYEARKEIIDTDKSITDALLDLNDFVSSSHLNPEYLKVWGNGAAFDNVILRGAFERGGIEPCLKWYNDLDVRTIVHIGKTIGFDPKKDMPFDGERHNALADAIHQARYVSAIYQKLLKPHRREITD